MRFFALIGLTLTAIVVSASPIVEDNAAVDENIVFMPEPFYKRALEVREKLLGTNHVELIPILRNYALLLKKTRRDLEAVRLEDRVRWIQLQSK